jgi:shikimate O-hydroxycinnamoyltransferase
MHQPFLIKAEKHRYQRIKCSLADLFVARAPVSVVFFYQVIISEEKLIQALEKVLTDFPIFAGILIKENHQLYIDCNNQGVQMHIEHLTDHLPITPKLGSLSADHLVDIIAARQALKYQKPLFTIRLRYHPNGMTIGYSWHHTLGDMATFMAFLNAFSLCVQDKPYAMPLIAEDRDDYLQQWLSKNNASIKRNALDRLMYMKPLDILRFIKHLCTPKRSLSFYFDTTTIEQLRQTMQALTDESLSRNDVVCAHMLHLISQCRHDKAQQHQASIAVNYRPRLGLHASLLGNYVDTLLIRFDKKASKDSIASRIRHGINHYIQDHFQPTSIQDFLQKFHELKKLNRVLPEDLMPKCKNLIISNWCNFGVYAVDFGIQAPYLFLPVGEAPFPWLSCIVEGPNNEGLLMSIVLPTAIASRLSKISTLSIIKD